MYSPKRFIAGASAVALASGVVLAGAGFASAQDDDEATGSLGSDSINFGELASSLETAANALNGPVTVTPNEEGGPTVTYTNETGEAESCFGFTMPYSAVLEVGLDSSGEGPASELLPQILEIQAMGGVSILTETEGEPASFDATMEDGVAQHALYLAAGMRGVELADGESITWIATAPDEPAAAVALCIPDSNEDPPLERTGAIESNIGIDPQVVADQINERIPGGSLELVGPDMISGGSVEMGATALGSLAELGS